MMGHLTTIEPAQPGAPGGAASGRLNAAIARAVVKHYHAHRGRGPTTGRAFFRQNTVVVTLNDTMTRAEHTLASRDGSELVLVARRQLRAAMRDALVASIEELTSRRVLAHLGDDHLDPDLAVEVFVLDGDVDPAASSSAGI
jgi:uncharacterized protein YbcI